MDTKVGRFFDLMKERGLQHAVISEARSVWSRRESRGLANEESLQRLRADIEERWGRLEPDREEEQARIDAQDGLMKEVKRMVQLVMVQARRQGRTEVEELHQQAQSKALALAERRGDVAACRARVGARSVFDTTRGFHKHPLVLVHHTPERWMCDGCEMAFDGDTGRYRCKEGCDYDICRECFTLGFMWVYEEAEKAAYSATAAGDEERHTTSDAMPVWVQHRMRKPAAGERGPPPGCWTLWHGHARVPVSL